jgi:hypothetical protein
MASRRRGASSLVVLSNIITMPASHGNHHPAKYGLLTRILFWFFGASPKST